MFDWFGAGRRKRRGNAAIVNSLFSSVAEAGRQPALYTRFGVADSVMGRFEMLVLHAHLLAHRTKDTTPALEGVTQEVVDALFLELDHSLREIGIGDTSIPKRMRKLGRMVYGRWENYGEALDANEPAKLQAALERNVYAEGGDKRGADLLADYVLRARAHLDAIPDGDLLRGRISYPHPLETHEASA